MKQRKWLLMALHLVIWVVYFSLPQLMRRAPHVHGPGKRRSMPPVDDSMWIYFLTLENLLLIPIFYLNAYYILPALIRKKQYLFLFCTEIVLFLIHYGFGCGLSLLLMPEAHFRPKLFFALMSFLVVSSIAYGFYAFTEARRLEEQQQERQVETMKAELQFLRWQISPHFLFNVLNNMVALARKKSDSLEPMIIHLSGLMRYMLYETDEAKVSLHKEVEYLRSFIELQSMRFHDVRLGIHIDIPEEREYYIEPMLLIPFVENAFKHGIDLIDQPIIRISLSVSGGILLFEVANKHLAGRSYQKDEARGIGLANVKKRLTHLYEGRYTLETIVNDWYMVQLKIELT
jgi:sensor histidine kinase YesM